MRLRVLSALLTNTLILLVAMGLKGNCRHTLLFPVTLPFGTVIHPDPVQYCTSNAVMPLSETIIAWDVSIVFGSLSCAVKTSTSVMLLLPLQSTCSQSGQTLAVS